jgi:hypothetical protein
VKIHKNRKSVSYANHRGIRLETFLLVSLKTELQWNRRRRASNVMHHGDCRYFDGELLFSAIARGSLGFSLVSASGTRFAFYE